MKNTEFCLRQSALRRALRVRDHDQCSTQTFISLQQRRFLRQQSDKEQPCKNSLAFLFPWKRNTYNPNCINLFKGLDGYEKMPSRNVELGNAAAGVPGCLGDIYEEFEKEDMSEMFRRAFLEQMDSGDANNR